MNVELGDFLGENLIELFTLDMKFLMSKAFHGLPLHSLTRLISESMPILTQDFNT